MQPVLELMQGPYAYLLILQILIVTALFLSLIGLVIRRLRGVEAIEGPLVDIAAPPNPELEALSKEQSEKIRQLELQIDEIGGSGDIVAKLKEQGDQYADKIKYLEQKLLEYEILQEEIGTLSQLKVENEKLKKEVLTSSDGSPAPAAESDDPNSDPLDDAPYAATAIAEPESDPDKPKE